jgi:CRP-like cAMP-binding protein
MNYLPSTYTITDLQHLPLLQVLSDDGKIEFLNALSLAHYPRYDYLFQPGQTVRYGYFVLKGAVRQYYLDDGKEVVTRLILENDMCTSFYSFISEKATFEYAEVIENIEVAVISRYDMERLCAKFIDIANLERKITEQYLIQEHERALSLQFHSAQDRYEHLVELRSDVFLRFSVGTIASYLGMSQETLSRLRTKNISKKHS